jgi:hypothetical protein
LVSLAPTIVNTSENVISRFSPQSRECFTDEEFYLKRLSWESGYRYSFTNCMYEALLDKVLTECKCVPDFFAYLADDRPSNQPCR